MEISEQEWLELKAEVTLARGLIISLLKLHPDRELLIEKFRAVGPKAHDVMLSMPLPDAQLAAYERMHFRMLKLLDPEQSPPE
jgi:hypothetical protein